MTSASIEQLAVALDVSTRTINRDLTRGLPRPMRGENLEDWATRARQWKTTHRRKAGRPVEKERPASEAEADARYRMAKAELIEIQLAKAKGELHSRVECEEQRTRLCAELSAAFQHVPDSLARRCYQAPSPDAIKLVVQEVIRRCFEVLSHDVDVGADAGDAGGTSVA
jgi:phage terminase Nu1 subunit (DNA packaging protein)